MAQLNSKLGLLTMDKETTYGTLATPTTIIPIFGETLTSRNTIDFRDVIVQKIDYGLAFTGDFDVSGGLTMPAFYKKIGYLLYALYGEVDSELVTNATKTYKHTFEFADELPSYSIYVDRITEVFAYNGCMATRGNWRFTQDEMPITFGVDFIAQKEQKMPSGTSMPIPTITTEGVFIRTGTTVKIGNEENGAVKSIDLTLDNRIDARVAKTLKSGRFITSPARGAPAVTGNITSVFTSMDEWEKFWGSTDAPAEIEVPSTSLEITVVGKEIETGFNNKLIFYLPKVYLIGRTNGTLARPGEWLDVSFDFQTIFDPEGGYMSKVELYNEQEEYE